MIGRHDRAAPEIDGYCASGFEAIAAIFAANFATRGEIGASVCLIHNGRTVVDLWGGVADPAKGRRWLHDTVSPVFSCTKAATALCANILIERGMLALHEPVATWWPAFACAGKERTTVAMMLAHTSPVPHLRAPIEPAALLDFDTMATRVANEPAWWEPGTRQGYHGLTYAWTVGQLVRLAAGESLGTFFRREVADRLGLDFHIGLPESEEHRVAHMMAPDRDQADRASLFARTIGADAASLPALFARSSGAIDINGRPFRAAEVGSANGVTNARGLAGLYAPLSRGGGTLLRPESVAAMARVVAATHDDATLRQAMRFGLGVMASIDNRQNGGSSMILGDAAFGHAGMGGSLGFCDPALGFGFGYTMNRMGPGVLLNDRGQSLVEAAYRAVRSA